MGVFEKTVAAGEEILKYIPQRKPMVMVDAFYGVEGDESVCGLAVGEDTCFYRDGEGVLDECGVIEHIAQSAAVEAGYTALSHNEPVRVGFIGSVSKLKIHSLPRKGEEIRTKITILQEVGNVTLAEAESTADQRPVCNCRMKIFLRK